MDFSGRREEAIKLQKEADKISNPSLLGFRLRGDWTSSTPLYERAATGFRVRWTIAPSDRS